MGISPQKKKGKTMNTKSGCVAPVLLLVAVFSILLNVYLFRIVYKLSLANNEKSAPVVVQTHFAREIAQVMGMHPDSLRTESDIATDIKLLVREAPVAPRMALSDDKILRLSKLLNAEDRESLKDWQDVMKKLAGKQYLTVLEE